MVDVNQFISSVPGPGGTTAFAPKPLVGAGGKLAPGIAQAGAQFASLESDYIANILGQKGLTDSSFFEQGIGGAFNRGVGKAINLFQNEQNLFSQWAALQNQIQAGIGPEAGEPSRGAQMFQGAMAGAGIGSLFGGKGAGSMSSLQGAGIGAGIGVGVSLLDQWLDLGIFN